MSNVHRKRRVITLLAVAIVPLYFFIQEIISTPQTVETQTAEIVEVESKQSLALAELEMLEIKGRAPKTGYSRDEFGSGWAKWSQCDVRQKILARDLYEIKFGDNDCTVLSGKLDDPYTGETIDFIRGSGTSSAIQIDHVVALSDAWQKGAQYFDRETRIALANDDLELLAVDGPANQKKSDGDAATWLPSNKAFRCQYVARQVAIKSKYELWVTQAEYDAIKKVLNSCPEQRLPSP